MLGITLNKRLRAVAIQLSFKDRQIPKSLISELESAADAECINLHITPSLARAFRLLYLFKNIISNIS